MTSHKKSFWETAVNHINGLTSIEILLVMTGKAKSLWDAYYSKLPEKTKAIYVGGEYIQKGNLPPRIASSGGSIGNLYFLCVHDKHEKLSQLYYDNVFEIAEMLGLEKCLGILPDGKEVDYSVPKDRLPFDESFMKFKNIHKGQRAFVLGNGPSLREISIPKIRDEITFCSNRIYLSFREWGFHFKYYAIQNPIIIDHWQQELAGLPEDLIKFFPDTDRSIFNSENSFFLKFNFPKTDAENVVTDEPKVFTYGKSVTYLLLQLAVFMGCDPIVMVGMDHEWIPENNGHDGKLYCRKNYHFSPRYENGLERQPIPNSDGMVEDYERVKKWTEKHERTILNASQGTRLNVFPIIDFSQLEF
jgi:hypothetical protein